MADVLTKLACELSGACASYLPTPDPVQNDQRDRILEIAREISMTVSSPMQFTWTQSMNMFTLISLRTGLQLGLLRQIPPTGTVTVDQISKKCGVEASLVERLFRVLAYSKVLLRDEKGEYGHTVHSQAYAPEPTQGILNPGELFSSGYDVVFMSMMGLHKYLEARGTNTEPDDQSYNPFTWYHGRDGKSCWTVQAEVGEEEKFQKVLSLMDKQAPPIGTFDFASLIPQSTANTAATRTILVDVAGGLGATLSTIVNSHSALQGIPERFVLEDRKPVIDQALKTGVLPKGVQTVVHDFFTENPIKGARAYMLRRILHDWSDDKCIEILKHLADAATPDTSILVSELVVPTDLGEKDVAILCSDMAMMHMGGKERTEQQWSKIFLAAGLILTNVWKGFGQESLLEARLNYLG